MCGRYFLGESRELDQILTFAEQSPLRLKLEASCHKTMKTGGEIFPGDLVPVIARSKAGNRRVFPMVWGFQNDRQLVINARFETAGEKPMFRDAWKNHRCIVPASHYFEWKKDEKTGKSGSKYLLQPRSEENTWLCGLYRMEGDVPHFVILTREPGPYIFLIHDRMPMILARDAINAWIDPACDAAAFEKRALTEMYFEKTD